MFLHGNVALPLDSSLPIEGIREFCPKEIRQEKLTKFIKIFELYQVTILTNTWIPTTFFFAYKILFVFTVTCFIIPFFI